MEKREPLVSVVVLSHDRPEYLPRALASVAAQTYANLEVIVVDNPSPRSEEIAAVVARHPRFGLIRNAENQGFTGGMNRGLEAASGEYVYCTVDDVLLERDYVERLVEYAEAHAPCGLLAGVLYGEDRRTIICAGGEFSLAPVYRQKIYGAGEQDVGQFAEPFEVRSIQGLVFSRLRLMRELKGFREDFFMYSESIELSARALKLGHKIVVVPQARAYVLDAPHAFTDEGIAFHKVKNLYAFYLLHARARVLPEFFLRYGVIQLARAMLSDRKIFRQMLRAWGWLLLSAPSLLRERRRWAGR